jgi:hypothetical protein
VDQVVERLPHKYKALSSTPSTTKVKGSRSSTLTDLTTSL